MAEFKKALKKTLEHEGVFSDHPSDSGGKTKFGITEATARSFGYQGAMKDLPKPVAISIYKRMYWDKLKLTWCQSQRIAEELFDTAVNCGPGRVVKWFQSTLNVLNRKEKLWNDIDVDGISGRNTMNALTKSLNHKNMESRVLKLLNAEQAVYYKNLALKKKSQEDFMGGWLDKRVKLPVFRKRVNR